VAHSKRYIISKWQRSAVGASVIVLGVDKDKGLCIALGSQKGTLRNPQGYMELPLPKEDLTGLSQKNASRLNGITLEPVAADKSIEENAVREIREEIGLQVSQDSLYLLGIESVMEANPITFVAHYFVKLPDTPLLQILDHEFADDDLQKPVWIKIRDLKLSSVNGQYLAKIMLSL
jgi:8-oxo-dGTP pyrophosphatase MutT (NUDIX family)